MTGYNPEVTEDQIDNPAAIWSPLAAGKELLDDPKIETVFSGLVS